MIDHVKPFACRGADDPSNMQWQTVADGKAKQRFRIRTFLSDLTIRNSNGFARSRLTEQIRIHFLLDSAASV